MRCPHCGEKLEAGNIYCKNCGHELQIVPDYDPLDELVIEPSPPPKSEKKEKQNNVAENDKTDRAEKKRWSVRTIPRIIWLSLFLFVALLAFLISYISISRENSYSYQLKKGMVLVEKEDYQDAVPYLKQAESLQKKKEGTDTLPLRYLAQAYAGMDARDLASECMREAVEKEETAREDHYDLEEIYFEWMNILNETRQTELIPEIIEECRYEKIQNALYPYRIEKPSCNTREGTYSRFLSMELEAEYGVIYYTLDGTEPTADSTRYEGPINLQEEGEVLLSAVAINKKGMISEKLVLVYKLEFNNVYDNEEE